jgi:hypothetical protein
MFSILVFFTAINFQCIIPGHSNRVCDCYLYEVLTIQNLSDLEVLVTYSAQDGGWVIVPEDTFHIDPGVGKNDTIELKLNSHLNETFTLWGKSATHKDEVRIGVVIDKSDTLSKRNVVPFDTTQETVIYQCDEKYYHYDTITVN